MSQISPQELKARLDRREAPTLLDVREDWETKLARLDNALHIPIEEIELRADELDPGDEIVVYCHQAAIRAYVREHNKHPRPFIWTATAAAILRKIKHCKQALETGH